MLSAFILHNENGLDFATKQCWREDEVLGASKDYSRQSNFTHWFADEAFRRKSLQDLVR